MNERHQRAGRAGRGRAKLSPAAPGRIRDALAV